MGQTLYVGNVPYTAEEADLRVFFTQIGSVETVTIMRDKTTGKARGFAFVQMNTEDQARRAIAELDGRELGGRSLVVSEARPQTSRAYGSEIPDSRRRSW